MFESSLEHRRRGGRVLTPRDVFTMRAVILSATVVWSARRSRAVGFVGRVLSPTETTSISSSVMK